MGNLNRSFAYFTANVTFGVFLCLFNFKQSSCSLNLFLDKNESHRFLGIPNELYYIQDGKVKRNALKHILKIPENYQTIHYTWEKLIPEPVQYTIDIEIHDKNLLKSVNPNVPNQGVVPSTKETVMIQFVCNGIHNGRVIVDFNLKFTLENSSVFDITFKREKYCAKEAQKISFDVDQQPLIENSDSSQLKIFYIVLCFGCSLFTLLILCFLAYVVSNKKDSRQNSLHTEQQIHLRPTETENVPYILSASAINSGTSTSSNISHSSMKKRKNYTQLDNRSLDLQDRISEITIQRKRIRLQKIELEGTFGRVFIGNYSKEDGSEEEVVVKTVMDFASSNQISLLLREGLTMYGLKHRNIMSVLGVSIEDHVEPFVIYLREGFTNLKKYLQKCKLCQEGITRMLTTQEVVEIALQVISGVQYMHKKKLLHKDLATRNCLLDTGYLLKPSVKVKQRPGHDLFLNSFRRRIRIRPPFRRHLSSCAAPFFLEYRRKNSARAKFDELVRERLRQIAIRSIDEPLQLGVDTNASSRMSVAELAAPAVHKQDVYDEESSKQKAESTPSDVRLTNAEVIKSFLADVSNKKQAISAVKPKVKRVPSGAKSASKAPGTKQPAVKSAKKAATGDTKTATPKTPTKGSPSKSKNVTPAKNLTGKPTDSVKQKVTPTKVTSAKPTDGVKKRIPPSPSPSFSGAKSVIPGTSKPAAVTARTGLTGAGETIKPTSAAQVDKTTPKSKKLASQKRTPLTVCRTPFFGFKSRKISTPLSMKPVKEPFSKPITFPQTTLPTSLSPDQQAVLMRRERRLERAWRKLERRISKSVPFPLEVPEFLKRPPELRFEQTRTCELRRDLNHKKRIAKIGKQKEFVRSKKLLKYIEPKSNLTQTLRYKKLKRKTIFTDAFEKSYSKYRKPPFQSIDGSLNVKVADNALSRDLFPNDYHCLGDNENRPVQWLAIESLVHRTFSTASDVWSFGVTLWELTTLGQQPYIEVDPFEIEHYLKDGYRLSQPVNCPDELFAVMAYCWAMSADERPTFSQLLTCLQDFRNQLNKYV